MFAIEELDHRLFSPTPYWLFYFTFSKGKIVVGKYKTFDEAYDAKLAYASKKHK